MYVSNYVCAKSALKHSNRTHNGVLLSEISSSSDHEEIVRISLATVHNHYILQSDDIKVYIVAPQVRDGIATCVNTLCRYE